MWKKNKIRLLPSSKIDKRKWDECIKASTNALIYARSFYLDHLHRNWCALVAEDYEWVFPITSRRKWTVSYLFQPAFVQQLGLFAKPEVIVPLPDLFRLLQKLYKFWEINWNYALPPEDVPATVTVEAGANYVLDLSSSYKEIANKYHSTLIKSLKTSSRQPLTYLCSTDYKNCIQLYRKYYSDRIPHITADDYQNFKNLCDYAIKDKSLLCRQVANEEGELLATILLLKDKRRLYNLINTTPPAGRKVAANHFLIDGLISEFAESDLFLDFEGSDLPGVKSFYESFGPVNQPYYKLKYNNLPWPINMLKEKGLPATSLQYKDQ
jgi:hypothetical protein